MTVIHKIIYLTSLVVGFVSSSVIPVGKCKLDDSSCLTPAYQVGMPIFIGGIPELEVEVLDPLELDDLAFDLSGLQFSLKDGKLKGLKSSIIDNVKWDHKKKRIEVDYRVNCTVKGHYTAGGRLLILPINGDGQLKIKLRNVAIKIRIDYKMETGPDGKEHVKPTKYDFTFDVIDNAYFNLTGLFNGNKELSDTMLTFLNENWKQVSLEFGRPIIDGAAKVLFKNVAAYFKNVPLWEVAQE